MSPKPHRKLASLPCPECRTLIPAERWNPSPGEPSCLKCNLRLKQSDKNPSSLEVVAQIAGNISKPHPTTRRLRPGQRIPPPAGKPLKSVRSRPDLADVRSWFERDPLYCLRKPKARELIRSYDYPTRLQNPAKVFRQTDAPKPQQKVRPRGQTKPGVLGPCTGKGIVLPHLELEEAFPKSKTDEELRDYHGLLNIPFWQWVLVEIPRIEGFKRQIPPRTAEKLADLLTGYVLVRDLKSPIREATRKFLERLDRIGAPRVSQLRKRRGETLRIRVFYLMKQELVRRSWQPDKASELVALMFTSFAAEPTKSLSVARQTRRSHRKQQHA